MALIGFPVRLRREPHIPALFRSASRDTDDAGLPSHRAGSSRGVRPLSEHLRNMAHECSRIEYRTSEITEYAVHSLSRTQGDDIGEARPVGFLNAPIAAPRIFAPADGEFARKADVELFVRPWTPLRNSTICRSFGGEGYAGPARGATGSAWGPGENN